MRDPFLSLRKEYRELVPVGRRRRSVVLLSRPMREEREPEIRAFVRPEDKGALRPLIERLGQERNKLLLRLAECEDGYLDADLLWRAGERIEVSAPPVP